LEFRLVSNKNFSEILPPNSLGPGPGKVGQGGLEVFHLRCHSQKIRNLKPKNFFSLQTRRLAESFEGLNRSLALTALELCLRKTMYDAAVFAWTTSINLAVKVLRRGKLGDPFFDQNLSGVQSWYFFQCYTLLDNI